MTRHALAMANDSGAATQRPWIANIGEGAVEHGPAPGHAPRGHTFIDEINARANWTVAPPNGLPTVVISITDREDRLARLPKGWHDVLRLAFQDYDSERAHPEGAVLFTPTMAARLARFARKHRGCNFVVHCAAGISRSGAVVEALLVAFPEYDDRGWPRFPNGHVKRLLMRALGMVPIGAEEATAEPRAEVVAKIRFTDDETEAVE